jgi:hypothetical protein
MKIIQTFLFKTDFYEQIRHKLSFIYKKIVRYGMHSFKNISERNKIDTQSRADEKEVN